MSKSQPGKDNPNYKHGIYCSKHYCQCGKEKDYRALKCIDCIYIDKNKIIKAVPNAYSFLNLAQITGRSRSSVTKIVKEEQLDISHFRPGRNRFLSLESIFMENSKIRYNTLRTAILRENILKYICDICKLEPIWQDKRLVL